jgi:DNA transformation protein
MGELTTLPNIGKVLEKRLIEIGVHTVKQLSETGSREAFIRMKKIDPGACLNMLYALQGAIDGVRSNLLPERTKRSLKDFYKSLSI